MSFQIYISFFVNESKIKISIKKGIIYDAVSGEKNHMVKKYKIISPDGEIFEIKSCYFDNCKEHDISSRNMKRYKNKGKIPPYKKDRILPLRINTTGWELVVN